MFELILLFIALFAIVTTFVLFLDKLGDMFDVQIHSSHHSVQEYENEDTAEKLVD